MTNYIQQQPIPTVSGSVSAIFQPGFAGTNPQEVRALNQGSFVSGAATYGVPAQASIGLGSANAIFQPGFAGTNVQEVRHWNAGYSTPIQSAAFAPTQVSYPAAVQSIFQPGFAGTDPQEVRSNLFGTPAMSLGMHVPQQQQTYVPLTSNVNAIFQPGFAGTNPQEVRALNFGQAQQAVGTAFRAFAPQQQQPTYVAPLTSAANVVFQPGFAGTNLQEVRALNAVQPVPYVSSILPGTL